MKIKKHRASVDLAQKTWKKIRKEAFYLGIAPKKLMQDIIEEKYK